MWVPFWKMNVQLGHEKQNSQSLVERIGKRSRKVLWENLKERKGREII